MTCGIYKITCVPTGDSYVGASVNVEKRFEEHKAYASNPGLYALSQTYGWGQFQLDLLEVCRRGALAGRESHYIAQLKPSLNKMPSVPNHRWAKVGKPRKANLPVLVPAVSQETTTASISSGLTVSEWLKVTRIRAKVTQVQVAEVIGVKPQTISNWENGVSIPSLNPSQTFRLCRLFGVELAEMAKAFDEDPSRQSSNLPS